MPAISTDTAARLMAVLYEYGNNEAFVYNQKFLADKDYIQERFGLHGGGVVDATFHPLLKQYIKELQEYYAAHDTTDRIPEWARRLLKERYEINLII